VGIGGHGRASGWGSTHGGAARSGVFRGVGGRAGRHRHRRLRSRDGLGGDFGRPLPRYEPSGDASCHQGAQRGFVVPPRRSMGIRGASKDRVGVGAVQNRRTGLGDHRDVCGDAGQPAHQRHATPRCATPRDASIPTRVRPHDAPLPTPSCTSTDVINGKAEVGATTLALAHNVSRRRQAPAPRPRCHLVLGLGPLGPPSSVLRTALGLTRSQGLISAQAIVLRRSVARRANRRRDVA
jgi:hypothetical protein